MLKCRENNVTMHFILNGPINRLTFLSYYLSFNFELKCDIDMFLWDTPDHTLNMWLLFDWWLWAFQAHPWERGCLFEFPWLWSHYDHSILQTSFWNAINQTPERDVALHYRKLSINLIRVQVFSVIWLARVCGLWRILTKLIDKPHWLTVRLTDNYLTSLTHPSLCWLCGKWAHCYCKCSIHIWRERSDIFDT